MSYRNRCIYNCEYVKERHFNRVWEICKKCNWIKRSNMTQEANEAIKDFQNYIDDISREE